MKKLEDYITSIPNYPKEGIIFRDLTSLVEDAEGLHRAVDALIHLVEADEADIICGIESRGFLFGAPMAYMMKKPFVMARKKGKLPRECIAENYDLEYGQGTLEMRVDSIKKGDRVVIVDDLMATGGTAKATAKLVERLGGEVVHMVFLSELEGLNAREALANYKVDSMMKFDA